MNVNLRDKLTKMLSIYQSKLILMPYANSHTLNAKINDAINTFKDVQKDLRTYQRSVDSKLEDIALDVAHATVNDPVTIHDVKATLADVSARQDTIIDDVNKALQAHRERYHHTNSQSAPVGTSANPIQPPDHPHDVDDSPDHNPRSSAREVWRAFQNKKLCNTVRVNLNKFHMKENIIQRRC